MAVLLSICSLLIALSPCKSFTKFDHFPDVKKMVGYFLTYICTRFFCLIYNFRKNFPIYYNQATSASLSHSNIPLGSLRKQPVRILQTTIVFLPFSFYTVNKVNTQQSNSSPLNMRIYIISKNFPNKSYQSVKLSHYQRITADR